MISSGVGGLTESDVMLAAASKARIIAFNVRADGAAREAMQDQNVDVRYYSVIYEAIDDVSAALTGMLAPEVREQIVGLAEVRDVFRSTKFGTVAGCLVVDGYVRRNNPIRVLRDNVVIFQGELESLKRFKDDAGEVRAGTECGIGVKDYNDVRSSDQIECFERIEVARQLGREAATMPREFPRARRVEEQLQRLLSDLMRREVKDPRVGADHDHRGEVSRTCTHAKVYFTPFAGVRRRRGGARGAAATRPVSCAPGEQPDAPSRRAGAAISISTIRSSAARGCRR